MAAGTGRWWPGGAGLEGAWWLGVGLLLLNAIGQIAGLPGYPVWFLVVTAVGMVVLCGLAIYGNAAPGDRPD